MLMSRAFPPKNRRTIKHNYDGIMIDAASQGNIDTVQLILDSGATDYDDAIDSAIDGGHIEIVKLLMDKGGNYNYYMAAAACKGNMEIVQLMLGKGACDYNWAIENATYDGYIEIVKLMLDKGAEYLPINLAAGNGHIEIVKLFLETSKKDGKYHIDYNTALEYAVMGENIDIVLLILDRGANNYDEAIKRARGGNADIISLITLYKEGKNKL